jgi:hypothetical protein
MVRHGGWFAHIVLPILVAGSLAGCDEETPSSSGYALPLRLNPLRVQGASDADSAAAWALFDRDTGTRWSPPSAEAELTITLDTPRALAYLKVFGPGTGTLDLVSEGGAAVLPSALDLSKLRPGWNQVALGGGDPIDRLRLRVSGGGAVPDLELWTLDAPRTELATEELLQQIAWTKLEGQADVVSAQPASLALGSGGGESCGDFLFELPRDPRTYRRAWIAYGATGLFRPFVVTRALNDGPRTQGSWLREDTAVGVFVEPIDPARLAAGLNWYQVCLPAGAAGNVVLQDARFVGELDYGTNLVEAAGIGPALATPTQPVMELLDPLNSQAQEIAPEQRIVVAFERWISPDAVLLATDRGDWTVDCLDSAGTATRLSVEAKPDENRGVALLVQPSGSETLCAGLGIQPSKATARVSFLSVVGSGARQRIDWTRVVLASPREHFGRVAWVEGWAAVPSELVGARIEVDGVDTGSADSSFAQLLQRAGNRTDVWPVTITARMPDGTGSSRQFVLSRYSDQAGRVEAVLGDRGTHLSPEESAERYGEPGESVSQHVDPDADISIRLGTHVGVDIPEGSVNGNGLTVTITHLDVNAVPPLDPGIINVTAPTDHAYEFLPHGTEFKKAVTVLLPFDNALLPPGYTTEDVNAYYYDPDALRWRRLTRAQIDVAGGTTRSLTDHFTVMINAVVVAPEHPQLASFNPNEISGIRAADPNARGCR